MTIVDLYLFIAGLFFINGLFKTDKLIRLFEDEAHYTNRPVENYSFLGYVIYHAVFSLIWPVQNKIREAIIRKSYGLKGNEDYYDEAMGYIKQYI